MNNVSAYPTYKQSGVQWLGDIPSHWETWKITHAISDIGSGTTPKSDNSDYYNGDMLWVTTSELRENFISDTKQKVSDIAIKEYSALKVFPKNSVAIAMYGATIGRLGILQKEATFNQACCVFGCSQILHHKFLFYWLWYRRPILISLSNGGGQPNLSQDDLKRLKIPLPPPTEQTAIAHYLDCETAKIDALLQKQTELLAKLSEKRTALITHAVTKGLNSNVAMKNSGVQWLGDIPSHWEIIKNKFILNFSKGLTITKENLVDDGIPCVNYGEIHSKYGFEVIPEKHYLKCVPESYLENAQNALLKNGDFVFSDTSEDIKGSGNFTYLNSDTPTFAGYHTIIARLKSDDVCSRFLAYVFSSEMHRNQVRSIVKGVKVFSITQAFLKNTYVYFPPLTEQTAIAHYLDTETAKIDALCDKIRELSERLTEYRTTLISDAVTGKIKVIP